MEPREIHWTQIHGNPLLRKLHPQMVEGIYLELKMAVIKGTATKNGTAIKEMVKVAYDRSFIVSKIAMLLKPLRKLSRETVEQLVADSLDVIYSEDDSDG